MISLYLALILNAVPEGAGTFVTQTDHSPELHCNVHPHKERYPLRYMALTKTFVASQVTGPFLTPQ